MGAGEELLESGGLVLQPADAIEVDRFKHTLQMEMGNEAYEEALEAGKKMRLEDVLKLARE
jgi:hypothetical protein